MLTSTVLVVLPLTAVRADPEPTTKELQEQAERLHNKVEVLAERYNGLRVELRDAKRAARLARKNAADQMEKLERSQGRIRQLAATRYMTQGIDPAIELATAEDPQTVLDRAATLHRLSEQDENELEALTGALESAERAQEAANKRADEVRELANKLAEKKDKIDSLLADTEEELLERATRSDGAISNVTLPGSGKAVQAANYALSQQGDPYVWGAGGPDSFDCSGLVMWAYQQVGIGLPHYTGAQYSAGTPVSQSELRVGDIVFFYSDLHHNGIYVGGGKFVHAPYTGTVVQVDSLSGRPFAGAVRVA